MTDANTEDRKQFHDLASTFDTAMLVTKREDGGLHARPMAVADLRADGEMFFSTALDSPKVEELEAHDEVLVTFQGPERFATLRGPIKVSRNPGLIDELWQPAWQVWFPEGKSDPNLCILIVTAKDGEFWDRRGGEGVGYRFAEMQRRIKEGEESDVPEENHAKVRFARR